MSGHVFVIQGSLAHLDYDAVVVSTDNRFSVTGRWKEVLGARLDKTKHCAVGRLQPKDWATKRYGRAPSPKPGTPPRPTWFVDSAWYEGQTPAEAVRQLTDRLAATLREVAAAGLSPRYGRTHPLVALPTLGTGGGGFGPVRGQVIDALLTTCQEAVQDTELDVVIVAERPSDYAAFQARRRQHPHQERHLPPELQKTAGRLAGLARQGHLALFLGAGVGIPAGLPTWKTLLDELSATSGVDTSDLDSDLDKAELLHLELGASFGKDVVKLIDITKRYAITHAMLASLGCAEIVTTNYDHLYERAASDIADGENAPTLPFDQTRPRTPWVLKMHGDIRDPKSIVLTRSDFVGYDAKSRPMGSIVQSLMITKHLLFVGASMTDDNFLRLAHEVFAFRASEVRKSKPAEEREPIGTVVTLAPSPAKAQLWKNRFTYVHASEAVKSIQDQARDLAIFLDLLAMLTSKSAHLLDPHYENLLQSKGKRAAAKSARALLMIIDKLPSNEVGAWQSVSEALVELGGTPGR
jgi:SIR2-like domain